MRELTVPRPGATVTDLTQDLEFRLRAEGMNPDDAREIAGALPPAGQYELIAELRDNPNAVQELAHTWAGVLQQRLRTDFLTADAIRARLAGVAR